MLLLGSTKRLSIDIDIIIPVTDDLLEEKLKNLVERKGFTSVGIHKRKKKSAIKKAHYTFYYKPSYKQWSRRR